MYAFGGLDMPTPSLLAAHYPGIISAFAYSKAPQRPVDRQYSAGGLIFDNDNRVAVLSKKSRNDRTIWCLPKGHIEKGETFEETAVREVKEETGILGTILGSIATIDYWFMNSTYRIHKLVHHYVLRRVSGILSVEGDPDREAQGVEWVDLNVLPTLLSYPNERTIVKIYQKKYCGK
ncbi:MAG: NUDIX hydrolase [Aeriscardovia sp.]|nr:NUDIX hydrolase [Aeriscardovia sp.]MBP5786161.1 NUDIX hydrolase [Aeriscardovia sp.]MBQ1425018.1 NUDIX hydrolase [Aeriscardovia sp.]MBQ5493156.1 NUDIX hydrolase [Aeriscardovia sp.]MBQ5520754.1 NUDIX hydrolase [Aeriscardovia sp.]